MDLGAGAFTLNSPLGTILSGSAADDVANITAATVTVTGGTSFGGAGAALDIDATTASVTGIGGDIVLDALGTGGLDLTAMTNAAGSITVTTTSENLMLADVTANNGPISVTATGQNITASSVTSSTDDDGNDITLTTLVSGNLILGSVTTAGAGDVTLASAGTITNAAVNAGAEVTTDVLTVNGATSFGESGGNGAVDIDATTASVTGIGGDIVLDAVGTDGLNLTATSAAGSITVTTTSENLTLANVTAIDGAISLTATGQNITASSVTSSMDDDGNDITLTTLVSGNLILGSVTTIGAGDVTLASAGTITNAAVNAGAEVTTDVLTVNGATSFGESGGNGAVDIDATTASVTGIGGDIVLDAVGTGGLNLTATSAAGSITVTTTSENLTLTNVTANNGPITVTATGQNITATSVISSMNNDITLTTLVSGNIILGSVVTTGAGDVTLASAGTITNAADNAGAEVTTDVLTVTRRDIVWANRGGRRRGHQRNDRFGHWRWWEHRARCGWNRWPGSDRDDKRRRLDHSDHDERKSDADQRDSEPTARSA